MYTCLTAAKSKDMFAKPSSSSEPSLSTENIDGPVPKLECKPKWDCEKKMLQRQISHTPQPPQPPPPPKGKKGKRPSDKGTSGDKDCK